MTPIEEAAKQLRLAFAIADPQVSTSYFIKEHPWEELEDHRKIKWIAMATAAFLSFERTNIALFLTRIDDRWDEWKVIH